MYIERVQARVTLCARQPFRSFWREQFIVLAIVVFGMSLAVADATPAKTIFNIEAQAAKRSLTLYARQAKVQLGFAPDIVDDILTNPVKGDYENAQALELLLKGTGLEAMHGESGIIIRRIPKRVVTSGIEEPPPDLAETNSLQLIQGAVEATSQPAAMDTNSISDEEVENAAGKLEEVVVTGSRIRGAQNASTVITLTRQEIDKAGFATAEDLFDRLPQNFGAGATQDTGSQRGSDAVGGFVGDIAAGSSVNLRGLGAASTLVLLNGRRMSPSGGTAGFTDVSRIPLSAIERVEVLTDGASAVYGADAIAGVVNFILRDDYEGAETRLQYGSDTNGDTSEVLFGQSIGASWDGGNALFSYEYYQHDELANIDRSFAASSDLTRFGGTDSRLAGGNPANIDAGGQTFAIPAGQDGTSLMAADFDPAAPLNLHDRRAGEDLQPQQERHTAFLHGSQDIGSVELFAEAHFSTRDNAQRVDQLLQTIDVPDTNPFFVDPTGTGLTTVTVTGYSVRDDLGPQVLSGETDSYGGVLGVALDIGDLWTGELVGTWSKEEATQRVDNFVDEVAFANAVNQTDPQSALNLFGDGSNTNPNVLDTIRTGQITNIAENELWSVGLNVDGEAFSIPGGPVQVATGIEFREDALLSRSSILEPGTDLSRDVLAVYAELFFSLVGADNSRPGVQRLELSLAGRYEDYSDFGSSTNPKVGLAWSPTQSVRLRATYGTSFKAPALFDLDVSNLDSNLIIYFPQLLVDLDIIPFPTIVLLGGNENLRAEDATTWTAGFQLRSKRKKGLSLDATYFKIDFDDRIDVPFTDFLIAYTDPRFASLLNTAPTPEQIAALVNDPRFDAGNFFGVPATDLLSGAAPVGGIIDARRNNLSRSVVSGVEFQFSYDFETALGSFDIGLNGNYLFDFKRALIAADPLLDEVDTLGRPVDFRGRGSVTWSRQGWSASGFINYTDGYTDNTSDPDRPIDSWTTVDLTVSYDTGDASNRGLFDDTRLSLTARNLFDEDPPFVNAFGALGYDSANASGIGRFVSFQITKEW